ncbi:aldose 1-epimerase [Paenibacillus cymbidii]|uniref:aldose 1-epimerase n=1 Tax=Paenibacillus cymbidii TaxID=1639034 RepID=UPI00108025FD|nr:aldose 1-epimerase [Paenibacillus cymbidii]
MTASIEHVDFHGEPAVRACNGQLEMTVVPGWGSNLISLQHKGKQVELLRVPEDAAAYRAEPILFGIPVLFPPNRIEDGTFTFDGVTYTFNMNEPEDNNHSHGVLFEAKWKLDAAEHTEHGAVVRTSIDSGEHPDILAQFPHRFQVRLTFRLEENAVYQEAAIVNKDNRPFPWGFGFHTTFRFPFRAGDSLERCTFALNVDRQWELNERFLPTGRIFDIPYKEQLNKGKSLAGHPLDDVFATAEQGENEAILHDGNIGLQVRYRCDRTFGHWVVYNADARQGYLCPEPYTWVTNAPNLPLPRSLTGLKVLQPGEQIVLTTAMIVEG